MAFEFATGTLNIGTGAATTEYSVTGKTGTWKAVILFWSGRAETTDASGEGDIKPGIGFAVSSTSRRAITGQSDHSPTTTATDGYHTDAAVVALLDTAGAVVALADFVAFTSDGFTLVVDDAFPAALEVSYILLGGADLTDVATGQFQQPAATGLYDAVTSLSFQPDFVLFASEFNNTTAPPDGAVGNLISIGAATSAAQAVLAVADGDNLATSITLSYCFAGEVFARLELDDTVIGRTSFDSFLSNGFKLNKLEGDEQNYLHYLALKGGSYAIGNFTTATNTTAFTEAHGMPITPKGAMFLSANRSQSTQDTPTVHYEWSIGASDGSVNTAQYARSKDAAGNADCFNAVEHNEAYINASNASTQAIEGLGHVNSFDATNINLQMTDADPAASFVWYIAFGNGAATDFPLNLEPGSYGITGAAATPLATRLINAEPGAYSLTGVLAALEHGFFINAEPGVYTITGITATLLADRVLNGESGTYIITGSAATILAGRFLNGQPGSYVLTGEVAGLLAGYILNLAPGSYNLSGLVAELVFEASVPFIATRFSAERLTASLLTGSLLAGPRLNTEALISASLQDMELLESEIVNEAQRQAGFKDVDIK